MNPTTHSVFPHNGENGALFRKTPERRMEVAVLGLGYVGCVTAACLAHLGHRVVGVDRDAHKVNSILQGNAPFFEPGLAKLVEEGVAAGRLSASTDIADGIRSAEIAMVCVGTPSAGNGDLSLDQLKRACQEVAGSLETRPGRPLVVAVRSTVYPGTCERIVRPIFGDRSDITIVSNPEFLREGTAVQDFLTPGLLVVGGASEAGVRSVADLYTTLPVEPCIVSIRTAEMIKYACNAFHALKIAFANEVGTLCAPQGVSGSEVMETLCQDQKLNISTAYLSPGFAFGGSCLPKDLRALNYQASRRGLRLPILESVLPSNSEHLGRLFREAGDLPAKRLAVYGLAFKENTDDLRESPAVMLLEHLIGKGRSVRVFDRHVLLEEIHGSNENYLRRTIPHIGRLLVSDFAEWIGWADHVILVQKPPAEVLEHIRSSGLPVLDLTRALQPQGKPATVQQTTPTQLLARVGRTALSTQHGGLT